ncbi:MAG: hypothetical protein IPF99_43150 [Deltaproteobacteria bacterium]|jgi:hypothetical protein|nr:hypothetical protein [Deltaproteobacteria bacterium]MBP6834286.1 hypothetical protein [Deltaproteobacteria bacterium]
MRTPPVRWGSARAPGRGSLAGAGALAGGAPSLHGALAQALHARGLDTDAAGRALVAQLVGSAA